MPGGRRHNAVSPTLAGVAQAERTLPGGRLPADDESGLVLYPAEGLLRSEKEAALRYAKDNLENLLHDLALEHLPRHVWLAGEKHSNGI